MLKGIYLYVWGQIPVYFVAPKTSDFNHVIFYIHGAGWVFGSFHTHEKLVRELAARTNSLVIFPEYTRSPEAKYGCSGRVGKEEEFIQYIELILSKLTHQN